MNASSMDFLQRKRTPGFGWCLLALGVGALVLAAHLENQKATERAAAERELQVATAALEARRPALKPTALTPAQRRAEQARADLQRPWLATLRAIEAATREPVYLLALAIEPSTGMIKLDAEAGSFEQALFYVDVLSGSSVLLPATLVSHEAVATALPGQGAIRFTVNTRWATR